MRDRSDGPGRRETSKEPGRADRDERETIVLTEGPVRTGAAGIRHGWVSTPWPGASPRLSARD
jgi:hypothetical protein